MTKRKKKPKVRQLHIKTFLSYDIFEIVSNMWVNIIETFWAQKIIQDKWAIFKKILNYTKPSCITLYAKPYAPILRPHTPIILITYEENQHILVWGYLSQNMPILTLYMLLTRKIDTFWSKGINKFWSGDTETVWHRKSQTKNQQYSQRFFELYQLLHE